MAAPFAEFAGNRRLMWIAEEWQRYADELAEWAMERIVNRRDVWSQYTLKAGEISVVMLPIKERRKAGTDMVTLDKLRRHFSGRSPAHLIGLHSISDHSTCKWFAIDIDLHDEKVPNADEIREANFIAAQEWSARLRSAGLDPILMDSNGEGGYHIWTLLDGEYPLADVYDYADSIRADYDELELPRKPEIFPPKRVVKPDDLPYTLRLPGRHHTRHHYTRIWNFDAIGENEWLEGGEAIEYMMAARAGRLPELPDRKSEKAAKAAKPAKKPPVRRRARVCVDLDGVLARYDGWEGVEKIGEPLPGALQFAKTLAKSAEIVVFTSRCSQEPREGSSTTTLSPGQLRIYVIDWLEKHGFPFADVYIGQGKPPADAFIDDRAVPCRPQDDEGAYAAALATTKALLKPQKRKRR